jgi:hypothetical protein
MLFRSEGPQVAVVGPDNKVQLRHINIGRDYGTTLEILGGVSPGDKIVINPSDSLEDGQQVNVAQSQPNQQGQTQASPQARPQGQKDGQQKGDGK